MYPKIVVFHLGAQCPWYQWVIEQAKQATDSVGGTLQVVDVTRNDEIASRYRLFSPFTTIINDTIHVPSPMTAEQLVEIIEKKPKIQRVKCEGWMDQKKADRIEPLRASNLRDACSLCIEMDDEGGRSRCEEKQKWFRQMAISADLGLIAYRGEQVVGAVEYLSLNQIPYPIRGKTKEKAFITCLYSMSHGQGESIYDCRGHLLEELVKYLSGRYQAVQVIVGRRAAYPNGPSGLFEEYGFDEVEQVEKAYMRIGYDEWILMERDLMA